MKSNGEFSFLFRTCFFSSLWWHQAHIDKHIILRIDQTRIHRHTVVFINKPNTYSQTHSHIYQQTKHIFTDTQSYLWTYQIHGYRLTVKFIYIPNTYSQTHSHTYRQTKHIFTVTQLYLSTDQTHIHRHTVIYFDRLSAYP